MLASKFGFMIESCIMAVRSSEDMICPAHKTHPLPVRDIAPDVVRKELNQLYVQCLSCDLNLSWLPTKLPYDSPGGETSSLSLHTHVQKPMRGGVTRVMWSKRYTKSMHQLPGSYHIKQQQQNNNFILLFLQFKLCKLCNSRLFVAATPNSV